MVEEETGERKDGNTKIANRSDDGEGRGSERGKRMRVTSEKR